MPTSPPSVAASRLRLRLYTTDDSTVVACSGRLTADVTAMLKQEVKALLPHTRRIVLDMSDLTHMDSSGLGAIVGLYVSARGAKCELRLINLNKQVRELLGLTNLLSMFEACWPVSDQDSMRGLSPAFPWPRAGPPSPRRKGLRP